MRTFLNISIFIYLSFFGLRQSYSQWQQLSSPDGDNFNNYFVAGSPNILSGATGGGLYVSSNRGVSWFAPSTIAHNSSMDALAAGSGAAFASFPDSTFYRSTDDGVTWTEVHPAGLPHDRIGWLYTATNLVFASLFSNQVYRSTDEGLTWSRIDTPQQHLPFGHFDGIPLSMIQVGNRLIAPMTHSILISSDEGQTWDTASKSPWEYGFSDFITHIGDTVVAGGFYGLAHSMDGGLTWKTDAPISYVLSLTALDNAFYAVEHDGGVYKSTDGGFTWTPWNRGLPDLAIQGIVASGQSLVAAGAAGFWRLPSDTGRWQWACYGMQRLPVLAFDTSEYGELFAGTDQWVFGSWDEGTMWTGFTSGYPAGYFIVRGDTGEEGSSPTYLPTVLNDTVRESIWESPGGGTTNVVGRPSPFLMVGSRSFKVANIDEPFFNFGNIIASKPTGLSAFDDIHWTQDTNGLPHAMPIEALGWNGAYLFAATQSDGMYRSSDTGRSWTKSSSGFPDATFSGDAVYDTMAVINGWYTGVISCNGRTAFVATPNGVFRSTDDGSNWSDVSKGLPSRPIRNIAAYPFGLFASADSGHIYFSPDNGDNWYDKSDGLSPATVYAFQLFNGDLYISNANGIFRRPIPEITNSVSTNIHSSSQLNLQFPNPYHISDQIIFSTTTEQMLDLRLYDILGREISVLAQGNYSAGSYRVSAPTSRILPGTYFLQLRSPGAQITRNLILEK